jgi:hypothetical protein
MLLTRVAVHGANHLPGLRRLPMFKLIAVAEVLLLAREHMTRLEPAERRRFTSLVRRASTPRRELSRAEHDELATLIAKTEPRLFAGRAAEKLSPVPLPARLVHGRRQRPADAHG